MAAPALSMVYEPLKLKTLSVGVALEHRLDTSELPDTIKADLERQRQLPGRYRIHHTGRKVERRDGQALTDEQRNLAMERFDDVIGQQHNIGAWMDGIIILTQSADGRTWTITDPNGGGDEVLGLGLVEGGIVHNIYFENGALKQDSFIMLDERAYEWCVSSEFELTWGDELVHTLKMSLYIEELDMQIMFTETFLARRSVH
jgi:hypothetical protein